MVYISSNQRVCGWKMYIQYIIYRSRSRTRSSENVRRGIGGSEICNSAPRQEAEVVEEVEHLRGWLVDDLRP